MLTSSLIQDVDIALNKLHLTPFFFLPWKLISSKRGPVLTKGHKNEVPSEDQYRCIDLPNLFADWFLERLSNLFYTNIETWTPFRKKRTPAHGQ